MNSRDDAVFPFDISVEVRKTLTPEEFGSLIVAINGDDHSFRGIGFISDNYFVQFASLEIARVVGLMEDFIRTHKEVIPLFSKVCTVLPSNTVIDNAFLYASSDMDDQILRNVNRMVYDIFVKGKF